MNLRASIINQTDVALGITKQLLLGEGKDLNLVFSPLSIHVVLSMIAEGSKGPTLDQLLSFLKFDNGVRLNSFVSELVAVVLADGSHNDGPGPSLSFANGVWLDRSLSLKPSFKQIMDNAYKAALHQADFLTRAAEVTNEVNSWAENKTNGLIKEVLPPGSIDRTTKLIFVNAFYFKAVWDEKFNASATKENDFHLLNGRSVQVPFMTSKKKQLLVAFDGFKVLGLPYRHDDDKRKFSMYFFLPDTKNGLPNLIEKEVSESSFLDHHLPDKKMKVGEFRIPKFKISFGFEASNVLKGLGLVLPFCEDADLTEIVGDKKLFVSGILHKSFIEVNEEGTEAAAVSTTVMVGCSRSSIKDEIDFVADHPFLFLIRDDMTGAVLFIGQVLNPLAG
ncbi:serpin-ZX-like [Juglans regia]|uniref:Serpin-ZX-like n=2 Tax=Juglans regia TaxID=51240 RepID=A0A2I4GRV1_JUGRE|nr:serpin-ZX-like [Juglans regia]